MDKFRRATQIALILAACLGIVAVAVIKLSISKEPSVYFDEMVSAARTMQDYMQRIKERRLELGFEINDINDPNGTGLIGDEFSDITTSAGSLEAKRSVLSPDMAALMVRLYHEAGVEKGDTIAIGASGSFPGAVVASLAAAKIMDLKVLLIVSCGSSNWGANIPELNIAEMLDAFLDEIPIELFAISLGGRYDNGGDMLDSGRFYLINDINGRSAIPIIENDLESAVKKRISLYSLYGGGISDLSAFVNIGGAEANIGEGLGVLDLVPGVNHIDSSASESLSDGGVVFAIGKEGVPIIHILNIKTLFASYQIPWDPSPFPEIGKSDIYYTIENGPHQIILKYAVLIAYVVVLIVLLRVIRGKKKNSGMYI